MNQLTKFRLFSLIQIMTPLRRIALHQMEEYTINLIKSPQEGRNSDLELKHCASLGAATAGIHRHVSMRYGVEFQSKVSLYAKERISCQNQISIESISKEQLFKKVILFLQNAYEDPNTLKALLASFKKLDIEMKLSVRRSRQSIFSEVSDQISNKLGSSGSVGGSSFSSGNAKPPVQLTKSSSPAKENGGSLPKLKKAKTSVMSKVNRISLVQAINLSEFHNFKIGPIEAIPSSQSFKSQSQQSLNQLNSRGDLTSDPSQTMSDRKQSMTSLNKVFKLQKRQKISIMMLDDFNSDSDIFSEEDIVSLTDLKVPELLLSESLLEDYFDFFSPFLVNLAICLFFKCLAKISFTLTKENVGWLFGIATVVAYKVYYDEPIDGLMQFFGETLSMPIPELAKLQRWFLFSVDYEVVVSTQQYQNMMFRLLSQKENSVMI